MVWGGIATTRLKFDFEFVSAGERALAVEGRYLHIICQIYQRYLFAKAITVMNGCSDESLLFRGRVAALVNHVNFMFYLE